LQRSENDCEDVPLSGCGIAAYRTLFMDVETSVGKSLEHTAPQHIPTYFFLQEKSPSRARITALPKSPDTIASSLL
jgi:hypothetical protein